MNEEKRRTGELLKEAERKALEAETKAEELAVRQEGLDELVATLKQGPRTKQAQTLCTISYRIRKVTLLVTFRCWSGSRGWRTCWARRLSRWVRPFY